eukprot:9489665-Lingulodinium_polyedra.AAC.1
MRQPSSVSSAKTRASPSVPHFQRRPQQGACQRPPVNEPPYPVLSETRTKSQALTGNSWQSLQA